MLAHGWFASTIGLVFLSSHLCLAQSTNAGYRSQEIQPETLRSHNVASIVLDKSLNTYHWTGLASYENRSGPWSVKFNEQFLSMLIGSDPQLTRDEQTLALSLKRQIVDNLQSAFKVSSFSLSDNQNIGINSASSHAFYAGVEYQPFDRFTILPMVGFRFDNQLDQRDKGLSYNLGAFSDNLQFGGYRTAFNGKLEYDKLDPRTMEMRATSLVVDKNFFQRTRNIFQIQYTRNRRDFYGAADAILRQRYDVSHNIETRTDDAYSFSDLLDYDVSQSVLLSFQGNVFSRQIARQLRYEDLTNPRRPTLGTTINELNFNGSTQITYDPHDFLFGSVKVFYQERDEDHAIQPEENVYPAVVDSLSRTEERKNNHARRTLLSLNLGIIPSPSDSIAVSTTTTLLQYDTPTLLNDDQRDELRYILGLTATHRFNRYLSLQLLAEGDLTHLVYLLATRSADNTWNRILRFAPRVDYVSGNGISSTNTFEVLANYTVYDFEYSLSPTRSFVFRQFGFTDSSSFEITRRLSLDWFSQIRLYERGELRWQEFTERPLNYFEDKTYVGSIRYQAGEQLVFSAGIRYFSQSRFVYQGNDRQLESFFLSVGPITGIQWHTGAHTKLSIKGWYEDQSFTGQPNRSYANMIASLAVFI